MSDPFYRSAELRWFLSGHALKNRFLAWFRLPDQELVVETEDYVRRPDAPPFLKLERERTDEYLLLPDCDTVSVKQRQGKLEVKGLVAGPRPFAQGAAVGRTDQWVKWSYEPSERPFEDGTTFAQQLESELDQSGPWCKVGKKRYLQKYSFDSGSLVAVSPDQRPDTGCNIEFTILDVNGNVAAWLTFGFEAFGLSSRIMTILDNAVEHFFALHGPAPVPLDERNSLSYPAWLAMPR